MGLITGQSYWIGQEVLLGFSVTSYGKVWMNFVGRPSVRHEPGDMLHAFLVGSWLHRSFLIIKEAVSGPLSSPQSPSQQMMQDNEEQISVSVKPFLCVDLQLSLARLAHSALTFWLVCSCPPSKSSCIFLSCSATGRIFFLFSLSSGDTNTLSLVFSCHCVRTLS